MKLPNRNKAVISKRKMWRYLLNREHPSGRDKARAFALFGFTRARWRLLANRVKLHARSHPVTDEIRQPLAMKYVVKGILMAADGRRPFVVAVWKIPSWEDRPRLVSAYVTHPPREHDDEGT